MGKYSIKELERLSGIKAHTIRIWEKRYDLIRPFRTDTNIRYYNDDQLKKILNVSSLVNLGYKISKVSKMGVEEMTHLLEESQNGIQLDQQIEIELHRLIEPCMNFDEPLLDERINELIDKTSLIEAFGQVFFPLLNRIGFLWATNRVSPAHEHFLSNKLMQVLYSSMNMRTNNGEAGKYLLFLPEWEEHEMLLLFSNYVLKKHGFSTIYIGKRVPVKNLIETINQAQPIGLLSILISPNFDTDIKKYFEELSKLKNVPKLIMGGDKSYVHHFENFPKMTWVQSSDELIDAISV
ncbi:MerR family transcriptional regulator [Reichenbachiella ulvae]|uniref:MerR family transcriptional regulator n=1 Tax=Reichenbachiella ulvae TaxID=2980104 RepID=A0ABT3CPM8_9BACT|nr:MerR family transcriptional regulator [Reichenbachiella ulvae]MCV9385419.1 MerR family transcriptional regulator [Reichenbachiella ulvae]